MRINLQSTAFNHSATSINSKKATVGFEPTLIQSKCIALPLGYVFLKKKKKFINLLLNFFFFFKKISNKNIKRKKHNPQKL